jgi:DNA polymerase-3 subunit beta
MEIIGKKQNLLEGLQTTIVAQKTTIPILANVLLEAEKDKLTLLSTDLDISIRYEIKDINIIHEGSITLPLKKLLDIIRELPDDNIHIKVGESYYTSITSKNSIFHIFGLSKDDYPIISDIDVENYFIISSSILKRMIKKTIFAAGVNNPQHVLNGALMVLNKNDNKIKLVATDGFIFASAQSNLSKEVDKDISIIIPEKTLNEIIRLLKEDDVDIKMYISSTHIMFKFNNITFTSRLIEGKYPEYKKFIPTITNEDRRLHIKTQELFNTCRRINIMTSEETDIFNFIIYEDHMKVKSFTPSIGEAEETIFNIIYKGEDLDIKFNTKHILNILKNVDVEEIDIFFLKEKNTGVIDIEENNEKYFYLIVPVVEKEE